MTVVITGASSGIGRATARLMADKGHTVYDLSRSDKPQPGVKHIYCDVTKRDTIQQAMQTIHEEAGRIDTLILCAGMGVAGPLEMLNDEDMQYQTDVNLYGPIRVMQTALPYLRQQEKNSKGERGRIIFISSMGGIFALPFQAMYSATKSAIDGIAFAVRNELYPHNITVCCVLPGDVKTGFTAARKKEVLGRDIYPNAEGAFQQMEQDEIQGSAPERIAKKILKVAEKRNPTLYYTPDPLSKVQYMLERIAPTRLALFIVRKMYRG